MHILPQIWAVWVATKQLYHINIKTPTPTLRSGSFFYNFPTNPASELNFTLSVIDEKTIDRRLYLNPDPDATVGVFFYFQIQLPSEMTITL